MELILKEDVENLGFKDDIVKVKNGYGRNFLIPNGLAMLATDSNKKVLAEKVKQSQNKQKKAIDEAQKIVKKLEKLDMKISIGICSVSSPRYWYWNSKFPRGFCCFYAS